VAPNGDFWFIRWTLRAGLDSIKRTDLVRIDSQGRVARFRAPILDASYIAVAADGTVWIAGDGGLARMDPAGHFQRIPRAPDWQEVGPIVTAPDGRVWLIFGLYRPRAAWLPPNPCLSRRQVTL
jgi:streptogramin lyase